MTMRGYFSIPKSRLITFPSALKNPATPSNGFVGGGTTPPPLPVAPAALSLALVENAALVACLWISSI